MCARREFQSCDAQQVRGGWRQGPEAVDDLFGERVDSGVVGRRRQPLVQREAHRNVGHVAFGQQRGQAQFDLGSGGQRPVEHRAHGLP